jgi:hypothetical protein
MACSAEVQRVSDRGLTTRSRHSHHRHPRKRAAYHWQQKNNTPNNTPTPEHDGFEPLAPLAAGQALAKRARVAGHQGLTKLVAIV